MADQQASAPTAPQGQAEGGAPAITPQLVRQVADRVYAMWLLDMKIQQERWRPPASRPGHQGGR
ncbi:MAG: hypothetical protein L0332_09155 [Chloroflexi bacterium]|nr:hypothetical protein [Chloroflexota bacterium]MCI0647419.1 hypothetical protein [Chloroflexota bacterium]MCI0726873.1 hypothetical protein [Chloroflexota bacterium]